MTGMRSRLWLAAIAAGVLVLSGCGDDTPGNANPTQPGPNPTEETVLPTDDTDPGAVPVVEEPLEVDGFLDRPCDLLPDEWLAGQGFKAGHEDDERYVECGWDPEDPLDEGNLGLFLLVDDQGEGLGGLQHEYEQHQQGKWVLYEPTTVAGYPAAFVGTSDRRSEGDAELMVGIQDDVALSMYAFSYFDNPDRAAQVAVEAAELVIETLKESQ